MIYAMKYNINNSEWVVATDKSSETNVFGDFCYYNGNAKEDPVVKYGIVDLTYKTVELEYEPVSDVDGPVAINLETGREEAFLGLEAGALVFSPVFYGLTEQGVPSLYNLTVHNTEVGEHTIIIKKMTEQELQKINTEGLTPTDIFDWLKQKINNTKNVPEGFELPVVSKNTITLISQAKVTISQ